jgi:hypothetical protein
VGRRGVRVALGAAVLVGVAALVVMTRPGPVVTPAPPPTSSPAASPAAAASPSATPVPAAAPTATPALDVSRVSLLDVRADAVRRLVEVSGDILHAGFDREDREIVVGTTTMGPPPASTLLRFALDGRELARGEWPARGIAGDFARCEEIRSPYASGPGGPPPIVAVGGKRLENVSCGAISPDGRWMTYWLWGAGASPTARPIPVEQWLIDLGTGERRRLADGLVHCGGCDSVPRPQWSPSGRYVYFSDVVAGGGRFFLADVRGGTARALTEHVPREGFDVPAWSPVADTLIRSSGGRILLERFPDGAVSLFGEWPARFDRSGRYLYSPAWAGERPATRTTILDAATGAPVAELAGVPERRTYLGIGGPPADAMPVVGTAAGIVAALRDAPGCAGTMIHGARSTCVAGASAAEISPDGSTVALVRATDQVVTTARCRSCVVAEIVLIDVATGREIATSSRAVRQPVPSDAVRRGVRLVWNRAGTHLLVAASAG